MCHVVTVYRATIGATFRALLMAIVNSHSNGIISGCQVECGATDMGRGTFIFEATGGKVLDSKS